MKSIFKLLPVLFFLVLNVHAANAAPKGSGLLLTIPSILAAQNNTPQPPSPTVKTVISAGGRIWMDRNLGASRVAISPTDSAAYGDLYQWGRLADGHESRTSPTTGTLSGSNNPGHGSFIIVPDIYPSLSDWRTPQNDNLWQGVSGTNNPCPSGFRLPSDEEWLIEIASWRPFDDANGAYGSPLKLVMAGYRGAFDGIIRNEGKYGDYWSSTVHGVKVGYIGFQGYDTMDYYWEAMRADGMSVRCIKN